MTDLTRPIEYILDTVKSLGADAADVLVSSSQHTTANARLREVELVEQANSCALGLRAFIGKRQSVVSTSDLRDESLKNLAEQAVAMAKVLPEDKHAGLASSELYAQDVADLDSEDGEEISVDTLIERAKECESAALGYKGVDNTEGASASQASYKIYLATSDGFSRNYGKTSHTLSVQTIAKSDQGMETDYDYDVASHFSDLRTPRSVGERAGERAVSKLNPKKLETAAMPVIFDPRIGASLLQHFAQAISGVSVAQKTSFLLDAMDSQVFHENIRIKDDPLRKRGHRSHPFDAEGIAPKVLDVVEAGVLNTWLLDSNSASRLGLATTGHASRSAGSRPSPSPSNLYIEAGELVPADLYGDINTGLYVTSLMGHGVNPVTGDYSRGATGFAIKNGKIEHAVSEVTIAGNLKDMFKNLFAANDLEFLSGIDVPTLRVEGMMVAGK